MLCLFYKFWYIFLCLSWWLEESERRDLFQAWWKSMYDRWKFVELDHRLFNSIWLQFVVEWLKLWLPLRSIYGLCSSLITSYNFTLIISLKIRFVVVSLDFSMYAFFFSYWIHWGGGIFCFQFLSCFFQHIYLVTGVSLGLIWFSVCIVARPIFSFLDV